VTIAEWLATREPAPPPVLRARILAAVGNAAGDDRSRATEICSAAGEQLLAKVLRDGCTDRDAALDLLTADALVTYAFEEAGASPRELDARASAAMARIASIGVAPA
jgi:uncharacterized membrane protein